MRGILKAKLIDPARIIAADPIASRRDLFIQQLGVEAVDQTLKAVRGAKIILLSVKPQQMMVALQTMGESVRENPLYLSIAAGVKTEKIENAIGGDARVVRAMPNTPMLVGEGMTAICSGAKATSDDLAIARRLFESAGRVIEVEESQMEAVTAVGGSGPAYVFYLAEQMIAAGVSLGLSPEHARLLALQTIAGSGKMLMTSDDSPAELRRKVTSPNGTTQAAIEMMESMGVGVGIQKGVIAASERGEGVGRIVFV